MKCPDCGFAECQCHKKVPLEPSEGALTPTGTALLTLMISDYRKRIIASLESEKPEVDHLDGPEYLIDRCMAADTEGPPSTLELAFAKEPERSIVDAALRSIGDTEGEPHG